LKEFDGDVGIYGSEEGSTGINTFDGSWVSSWVCEDESFPEDGYELEVLVINGRSASLSANEFVDAQCQVPDPEGFELLTEFSLVYPGGSTSTARGDAVNVDVTPTTFIVNGQPLTDEQQQASAEGGGFNTRYSIILLDSGMLFLGNDEDGSGGSAANRSTQLSDLGFTMQ